MLGRDMSVKDRFNAARLKLIELKNRSRIIVDMGENSPINNDLLPSMPQGNMVIIADEVQEILKLIQEYTQDSVNDRVEGPQEVPFLLYGKKEDGIIFFNHIEADLEDLQGAEASFHRLADGLNKYIEKSKKDGTDIVAHGHTHPVTSTYNKSFSLGDMNAYKTLRTENEVFNSGKIGLCSCLLADGDYNFLFFDGNDYYKYNDVFVQNLESGDLSRLPSYRKKMNMARNIER